MNPQGQKDCQGLKTLVFGVLVIVGYKKYSKIVKLVHKLVNISIYLLVSLFTNRSWKLGRPLSLGKDI